MLRSSTLVSAISLLASLFSFINQVLIARFFGAGLHLDSFLIAVSVPSLLNGIVSGIFSYAIVPALVKKRTAAPEEFMPFSRALFCAISVVAVGVVGLAFLTAPMLVRIMGSRLPEAAKAEACQMARVAWAAFGCSLLVSCLTATEQSMRRFLWPAFAPAASILGMVAATLLGGRKWGVMVLPWGMLAGAILALPLVWHRAARPMERRELWDHWPAVRSTLARIPLIGLSMVCFAAPPIVDAFWASRLAPGAVSTLGYGQRILITIGGTLVAGASVVITAYLAELAARREMTAYRRLTSQAVRMVLLLGAPSALLMALLRVPLIEITLERGAFDHAATVKLASVLPGLMSGMVGMIGVVILFRAAYAAEDVKGAAMVGMAGAVLYFTLAGLLSHWFGMGGIVAAYVASWWLAFTASLLRVWRGNLPPDWLKAILRFTGQLAISLLVTAGAVVALKAWLVRPAVDVGRVNLVLRLLPLGLAGGLAYVGLAWGVFRMPEWAPLFRLVGLSPAFAGHARPVGP